MDKDTAQASVSAEKTTEAPTRSENERREAYGTAKTENLRDSGLWRLIIPTAVTTFCLTLFIVPLLILVPLLTTSIEGVLHNNPQEAQLLWVWITMIVIEFIIAGVIAWGMMRALVTQAGNYPRLRAR